MWQSHTLQKCFFFSLLCLIGCSTAVYENCTDYGVRWLDRLFHFVPGQASVMNCTLKAAVWVDIQDVPYNVSWYDPRTQRQLGQDTGRTLAKGTALWLFNTELEDTGAYVCVVRTHSQCFQQTTYLIVNQTKECNHPNAFYQPVANTAYDQLVCPGHYKDLITKEPSIQWHKVQWYKGCDRIEDGEGKYTYLNGGWKLKLAGVQPEDRGFYTCTISFVLAGVPSNISATIDCHVNEACEQPPHLVEPASEIVKATLGSSFSKACRAFVPVCGKGDSSAVLMMWLSSKQDYYFYPDSTQRVYSGSMMMQRQKGGVMLKTWLYFSKVEKEDFNVSYTCQVHSYRAPSEAYFTLLPADPNPLLPVGLALGCLVLLFTAAVIIHYHFKIHIVLLFRGTFPFLYKTTDSDGKLYDAYVAYPRLFGGGAGGEAETFVLHTLPQVLEERCGYRLFIFGRDSPPGEDVVDVVEESMQASRRLLLLYSASTFGGGSGGDEAGHERYEREAAMHRALREGSLQVVLVELEEVSPSQLALFPPSVRHLRERQGAVCLWKSRRTRRGPGGRRPGGWSLAAEEAGVGAPSPPLSSLFWKELRYHMPVRA